MLEFAEALERSTEIHANRHLLLGNGFSIACARIALPTGGCWMKRI